MVAWCKNSRKIGSMMLDVGKLISLGNVLDREITCLVSPTTSVHLILSHAKEILCLEPVT